jgi:putative DNA primase/helicase
MRASMTDKPNPLDIEAEKLRARLRLVSASGEPPEITPESCGIDPDQDWKATLIQRIDKKTGEITYPCRAYNLMLILENDPQWKGRIRFDEFRQQAMLDQRELTDADVIELKAWFEKTWISTEVKTTTVHEAVETVANRHAFHPIRTWLHSLTWDGIPRIDTFFSDYCGTAQTPYALAVARSFFVSAVARVMRPGCKVDTMLILEGAQGIGKSRLLLALFSPAWHAEIMYEPGKPDFCQALRGKWCAEFGELAAMGESGQQPHQASPHANAGHLPQILRPSHRHLPAPKHFCRDHQPRRLGDGRNRTPAVSAHPLCGYHSRGDGSQPRSIVGRSAPSL